MNKDFLRVAVVQLMPAFLDNESTLQKIDEQLQLLKNQGVTFALFPESTLPGYPRGLTFGTSVGRRTQEGRDTWAAYQGASIREGDETFQRLSALVSKYKMFVAIGVTEKDSRSSTLYCSVFYFDVDGSLLHVHRKVKPTGSERIIWGEGSGQSVHAFDTPWARVGGLICWENYMPEVRMKLYLSGIDLYCAPTADARSTWLPTMQHIALESRCYVLSANQYFVKSAYPKHIGCLVDRDFPEVMCRGGSCIISPYGEVLSGPLWDVEGTLIYDLDLREITKSRMDFDPIGHYRRADILDAPRD